VRRARIIRQYCNTSLVAWLNPLCSVCNKAPNDSLFWYCNTSTWAGVECGAACFFRCAARAKTLATEPFLAHRCGQASLFLPARVRSHFLALEAPPKFFAGVQMSTSSVASDGRPTSSGSNKDRASTPTKQSSSGSSSASKPGGLIKAFGTLRIDGKDAPSSPKIADLMERSESTSVPNPADVQVTDPIREKAVATKKYLRKKYEERARNEELAFQRRKAFEVRARGTGVVQGLQNLCLFCRRGCWRWLWFLRSWTVFVSLGSVRANLPPFLPSCVCAMRRCVPAVHLFALGVALCLVLWFLCCSFFLSFRFFRS
jgi:hypothetical protein